MAQLISKIGDIGRTVITRGLNDAIAENEQAAKDVTKAMQQYLSGDWGILCEEDKAMNDAAVKDPGSDRILAKYATAAGEIYIITEYDRSYTTLMFCHEY